MNKYLVATSQSKCSDKKKKQIGLHRAFRSNKLRGQQYLLFSFSVSSTPVHSGFVAHKPPNWAVFMDFFFTNAQPVYK